MPERIVLRWPRTTIPALNRRKCYGIEGKAHLIRQRETFEDILRNQIEIEV